MKQHNKGIGTRVMRLLTAGIALASASTMPAQNSLSKEITIERDIVPELRGATRMSVYPKAVERPGSGVTLQVHDMTTTTAIPPMTAILEAASTGAALPQTPYRGYVDAGYFPLATAGLSAGYAILSDEATRLNVWGQFDNQSYKRYGKDLVWNAPDFNTPELTSDPFKASLQTFSGRVGVDFAHKFNNAGTLSAFTTIGYHSYTTPDGLNDKNDTYDTRRIGALDWTLGAKWNGNTNNGLRYHFSLGTGIFNFTSNLEEPLVDYYFYEDGGYGYIPSLTAIPELDPYTGLHQTDFNASAGIGQAINETSFAGVDLSAEFNSYNHWRNGEDLYLDAIDNYTDYPTPINDTPSKTLGLITFRPYYRLDSGILAMRLGVNLEASVNSGKTFHVAPDVMLALNPAAGFGLWLKATGGERLNSLRELFGYNRFTSSLYSYKNSSIPVNGQLGLRFGPFKGVSVTLDAAYAMANDWLMPVYGLPDDAGLTYYGVDLRSWKAGGEIRWEYGTIVEAGVGFHTLLGNSLKDSWMEWRDRERSRLEAAVTVRPISRLTIDLGYTLAMKRKMSYISGGETFDLPLGDKSNLSAGASYRFTDAFTVFARGENLLNEKKMITPELPGIGVTGLIGVGFKF